MKNKLIIYVLFSKYVYICILFYLMGYLCIEKFFFFVVYGDDVICIFYESI